MEHVHHAHVVKRGEHTEAYDNHKVYASCYAACLSANIPKMEAEKICASVMEKMDKWVKDNKSTIASEDIFQEMVKIIAKHNEGASLLYKTHRDVS